MENEELKTSPNWRQRLSGRRIVVIVLAVAVVVAAVAFKIRHSSNAESDDASNEPIVVGVRTVRAEQQPIANQVSALGTIFPRSQATVSAKIAGQITKMALLKNLKFKTDEVVAVIESRDLQAQRAETAAALEEAKLNLRNLNTGTIPQATAQNDKALQDARANVATSRALYERRSLLFEKGGIARKEVEAAQLALTLAENDLRLAERTAGLRTEAITPSDRAVAQARVKQAEGRLATLEVQLSYANLKAPFAGIITDQFQFQGEFASPGAKLFTIADTTEVIVKAPFGDTVARQLKVGDPVTVNTTDAPEESFPGRVSLISKASDPQARTVEVWVNLKNENGKLRAGTAALVTVSAGAVRNAIVVPASAVTLQATNENEGTVMVVDNQSTAHEIKVTVGIRTPDRVQITSGLNGGETVVVEGNYSLPDGTKVQAADAAGQPKHSTEDKQGKEP